MNILKNTVDSVIKDLENLGIEFCFVGALAIAARGRLRQTVDADIALIMNNISSQEFQNKLISLGYGLNNTYLKENEKNSICLLRMFSPEYNNVLTELDFLIDLCGIEEEVVKESEKLEIWPGIVAPIASLSSIIAMKARCQELPERIQDKADLVNLLIPYASKEDIEHAKSLIKKMYERGYGDGRDLLGDFEKLIETIKK